MKIDILIPTFNRSRDLQKNLNGLCQEILEENLTDSYAIIVSDNCSDDNTEQVVIDIIQEYPLVKIRFNKNEENIGLEGNVVKCLELSSAKHVLCLGDDDVLEKGYLGFCHEKIKTNENIGCIIPGLKSLDQLGDIKEGRVENFAYKDITPSVNSLKKYSHYAHQMSGLVLKKGPCFTEYLRNPEIRNPYLFIFFAAYNLLHCPSVYAPSFKTTINLYNPKAWDYNEIGLLDEVFKSYYYFIDEIGAKAVADVMIRFVVMHGYRVGFDEGDLLKKYFRIIWAVKPIKTFKTKLFILFAREKLRNLKKKKILKGLRDIVYRIRHYTLKDPLNKGAKGKLVVRYISWFLFYKYFNRKYRVKLQNGYYSVVYPYPDHDAGEANLFTNNVDYLDNEFIRLNLKEGDFVVDAGCNVGNRTLVLSDKISGALMIDPNRTALNRVLENLKINNVKTENYFLVEKAVADSPGVKYFSNLGGASTQNAIIDHNFTAETQAIKVDVTTIDAELDKLKKQPSFIKIDVEGYDLQALQGAYRTLRNGVRLVKFEFNDKGKLHLFGKFFDEIGWTIFALGSNGKAITDFLKMKTSANLFATPDLKKLKF